FLECILIFFRFFFFSSRRRHTSFSRDWSSDVCSSDLIVVDETISGCEVTLPAMNKPLEHVLSTLARLRQGSVVKIQETWHLRGRSEERRVGKVWKHGWHEDNQYSADIYSKSGW